MLGSENIYLGSEKYIYFRCIFIDIGFWEYMNGVWDKEMGSDNFFVKNLGIFRINQMGSDKKDWVLKNSNGVWEFYGDWEVGGSGGGAQGPEGLLRSVFFKPRIFLYFVDAMSVTSISLWLYIIYFILIYIFYTFFIFNRATIYQLLIIHIKIYNTLIKYNLIIFYFFYFIFFRYILSTLCHLPNISFKSITLWY